MTQPILLSAAGLTLGFRDVAVIEDVTFELARGDVLAVVGHNGAGKSTLIRTLLGGLPPLAGVLNWPLTRPQNIAYLGQQKEFDNRFPIRVRDLAAMGAWSELGFLQKIDGECRARIEVALESTGMTEIADMPLHKLSAGQLQRALFARTMVQNAPLILLDEPFTAIDQTTEAALLALVDGWAAQGRTVVMVLHDLSTVLQHCNSVLLLGNGRALFGDPQQTLTPRNLVEHAYLSQSQAAWIETMYRGQDTSYG